MRAVFRKTEDGRLQLEHFGILGFTNPEEAFQRAVDIEKTKKVSLRLGIEIVDKGTAKPGVVY
jgi:hypothetical protein